MLPPHVFTASSGNPLRHDDNSVGDDDIAVVVIAAARRRRSRRSPLGIGRQEGRRLAGRRGQPALGRQLLPQHPRLQPSSNMFALLSSHCPASENAMVG